MYEQEEMLKVVGAPNAPTTNDDGAKGLASSGHSCHLYGREGKVNNQWHIFLGICLPLSLDWPMASSPFDFRVRLLRLAPEHFVC